MTLRSVQNEVVHLMEIDKFDVARRNGVLASINNFINSKKYVSIISVAIRNQKNDDVINISSIPLFISIVVSCIQGIKISNVQSGDMKYFIYGIIYSFITTEDSGFFQDISIETFERLYSGIFDILLIAPTAIEVSTGMCDLFCK